MFNSLFKVSLGLGLLCGLIFGSVFFTFGGYMLPFLVFGI